MAKRSGMGCAALLLVAALGCGDGGHATGVDGDQQARPRRVLAIDDREVRPQRRVVRRLGPERLDQAEPVRVLCARSVAFPLLTDGRLQVHGQCKAVKTITIDLEAYEILSRCKRPGESFSQTIKQRLGRTMTAADLRKTVERIRLSEETLDAIDAQVKARRSSRARRVRL